MTAAEVVSMLIKEAMDRGLVLIMAELRVIYPSALTLEENFNKRALKPKPYPSTAVYCAWPLTVCVLTYPLLCTVPFLQSHWLSPTPESSEPPLSAAENTQRQVVSACLSQVLKSAIPGSWGSSSHLICRQTTVSGWPCRVREKFTPAMNDRLFRRGFLLWTEKSECA